MKTIKTVLTILSICSVYAFAAAQGNCQGDNIRVYKGASGCGCRCQKECVTPAELPVYLADGWNTTGCWNCCKFKNWVDAGIPKNLLDEVDSLTVSLGLASASDLKIQVTDLSGRCMATAADETVVNENNEFARDPSVLDPGIYLLHFEMEGYSETKKIVVTD